MAAEGPPAAGAPFAAPVPVRGAPWARRRLWRTLRRGSGLFNIAFLALVLASAILAPAITSFDPTASEVTRRLLPPVWINGGSSGHLLGTDQLGRDVFARLVYGSRISLTVGLSTVVISAVLGSGIGIVAGYYEGRLGAALMRIADIQLAFPFVLLAIAIVAVLGVGLLNVILILGIAGWVFFGRLARSQVLSIKQREYIEAARALGVGEAGIVRRHILPNLLTPVIVLATSTVANNIVVEASLTFLGLGVQPDLPSWGNMLAGSRDYLNVAWWMSVFPGLALTLTVLTVNLLGDWLRDYLDPTLRNL
jgi:peptide/nickel transport system permease protein